MALHLSTAFGATTTWTDGTSSWFTSTNWDHGEPDTSTDAQINNGGTAQIITDVPQAVALSLTLALNSDQSGTVQVSAPHGGLSVGQAIFVGYRGKGNLAVTDGDSVSSATASIGSLTNAPLPPSHGSVTLNGGGLWTVTGRFDVGGYNNTPGGVALLSVTNGSTVSAGSVRVYNSGTLMGDGTISTTSGITVDGTISRTAGTLTISGGLSLTSAATTQCSVTPQDLNTVDVSVSGAATLTGRVSVTMTGTFTPCTQFTLLHATGGVLGTFQTQSINYPQGQGFIPVITYDANNVYLHLESSNGCH